jgi:hypothetical protein
VLGTSTLRQIGRHVGQTVTVTVSGRTLRERIVGRAVFPNLGQGSFTPTDLGQGAETTAAVLKAQAVPYGAPPGFQFVLLNFTPGPNRPANIAGFQRSMTSFCQTIQQSTCVVTSQRPNGATNYASIDRIPAVLAALLAVIGVAVLGQFIVVSGRRRRRDFAIFKALGMLRGPDQRDHRLAGQHADRTRPSGRPAARRGGRAVELGALRPRPRHPSRRHHADPAGSAHDACRNRHSQRGRVLARPGNRTAEPSGGTASRIARSGSG